MSLPILTKSKVDSNLYFTIKYFFLKTIKKKFYLTFASWKDLKQANLTILLLVEMFLGYIVNNMVYGERETEGGVNR